MKTKMEKILSEAIDKLINEFYNKRNFVFENDSERLKFYYQNNKKQIKKWKKSRKCIYKNCNKKSIKKSHTIPKSSSLKVISEDNHLYTPDFDVKSGKMQMKKIGLNVATTFPGFCEEHELIFREQENLGTFNETKHYLLQIYRSICREIIRYKTEIEFLEQVNFSYQQIRNKKIIDSLYEYLKLRKLKSYKINLNDTKSNAINHLLSQIEKEYEYFNNTLLNNIINDIENNSKSGLAIRILQIDEVLPVCLSGKGNFKVDDRGSITNIHAILLIIPEINKTNILFVSAEENSDYLNSYLSNFPTTIEILDMLESWMIYGTDHWFITPSVWDKITNVNQQKILNDLIIENSNIGSKYKFTIFNDLKRMMIKNYLKEDNLKNSKENFQELIHNIQINFSDI